MRGYSKSGARIFIGPGPTFETHLLGPELAADNEGLEEPDKARNFKLEYHLK